ncbi:MAG: molybdenum cofactor biosynthesis protein MoaE [Gemmatimonadaceae bacterium]
MIRSAIVDRAIDVPALVSEVSGSRHGAISIFIGTVRDTNDGRDVSAIEYSAYESMAEIEMQRICTEAARRFDVESIAAEHRVGLLAVGDASVVICVAHQHRTAAQDCSRYVIEEMKKRVPIWKLEHYADGTREWVDPTRSQTWVSA